MSILKVIPVIGVISQQQLHGISQQCCTCHTHVTQPREAAMQQPSRHVATCSACKTLAVLKVTAWLLSFPHFCHLDMARAIGLYSTMPAYHDTTVAEQGYQQGSRSGQGRAG